jgi:hypothetical protein
MKDDTAAVFAQAFAATRQLRDKLDVLTRPNDPLVEDDTAILYLRDAKYCLAGLFDNLIRAHKADYPSAQELSEKRFDDDLAALAQQSSRIVASLKGQLK